MTCQSKCPLSSRSRPRPPTPLIDDELDDICLEPLPLREPLPLGELLPSREPLPLRKRLRLREPILLREYEACCLPDHIAQNRRSKRIENSSSSSSSSLLSYIREMNTQYFTDRGETGVITEGVMLNINMLCVIDFLTFSVKKINVNSNIVVSCIQLSTRPWAITRVERDESVVVCDNKLVFIDTGMELSVMKRVDISSGECCGIVYTNNTLIVSFLNPVSVKILDLDGRILKTISSDDKGQNMFKEPSYIALSPDEKTLYVSDERKGTITSMDLNGTVQNIYASDTLVSPSSLAVNREGNIYIAGLGSENMHIISPDFKILSILNEETLGISSPYRMICCDRRNKLYISHQKGFVNPVHVVSAYQIE